MIDVNESAVESQETVRDDKVIEVNSTEPLALISKKVRFNI